jgi:YfiH family protein
MKLPLNSKSYIEADWPVPSKVRAYTTTRIGGNSLVPYEQFNLAYHVGDSEQRVSQNRHQLMQELELKQKPIWLEQVHSTEVVDADQIDADRIDSKFINHNQPPIIQADASFSAQANRVCVVMTADCLPVLLANKTGDWVAAVHAGWRGLADGIVQKTLTAYPGEPSELVAWLGPAISQTHFEVGGEVKLLFEQTNQAYSTAFKASEDNNKYHCDLYAIARSILKAAGIIAYGGNFCSFSQSSQFYSYRRDGQTGRMASLIWIESQETNQA